MKRIIKDNNITYTVEATAEIEGTNLDIMRNKEVLLSTNTWNGVKGFEEFIKDNYDALIEEYEVPAHIVDKIVKEVQYIKSDLSGEYNLKTYVALIRMRDEDDRSYVSLGKITAANKQEAEKQVDEVLLDKCGKGYYQFSVSELDEIVDIASFE